ncbi:MAG TPA: RNA polymerase sigma factor SigJ [Candidatus Dormibacteraeota bacterium]|nr:RNA polymerase sigma factor SigJ [Candidatus Dormibacteraeota bacterium]
MGGPDATSVVERERRHLLAVAYRKLGSTAEAEDAVQEAFLRWTEADRAEIENPGAWLTTVLIRHCLDRLKSARARRELYVGTWLPDPLLEEEGPGVDPADRVTLDESVSLAMLVVLETLSPAERAVFVLHDVFGLSFEEVSAMVGRAPAACRQLGSRARHHVEERRPRATADAGEQRRVVAAFLEAAGRGDLEALLELLDPSVVLRADSGGKVPAARRPESGAGRVAGILMTGRLWYPGMVARTVSVNGGTGAVVSRGGSILAAVGVTVADGRITEIDIVVNPEKLEPLRIGGADPEAS